MSVDTHLIMDGQHHVQSTPHILRISTSDIGGGAERVADELFAACSARGYRSSWAVGRKQGQHPHVFAITSNHQRKAWTTGLQVAAKGLSRLPSATPGIDLARNLLPRLERPRAFVDFLMGHEDFNFPGTRDLVDYARANADLVHCHNLHGGYFDLRELPRLSRAVPVVFTISDGWLLSGHCAHSFDCDRWEAGCGHCPDLTTSPAIRRDATAFNWRRKRDIFLQSRVYVTASSHWMMNRVRRSMLWPAVIDSRVIPNGIDCTLFHPGARDAARRALGISPATKLLLFAANGIRKNPFKDYQTLRAALGLLGERIGDDDDVTLLALGDPSPPEQIGRITVRFVPYERDRAKVAQYFQAADLYLHAARAEVWGLTITEALACGTPVVATAVGGIPEQVKGLRSQKVPAASGESDSNTYDPDEATGILVNGGDAEGFANAIRDLLHDEPLRRRLAANASNDVRLRFDLKRYESDYLEWYDDILQRWKGEHGTVSGTGQD